MDHLAWRSCLGMVFIAVAIGCSAKSDVSDVPKRPVDGPRAGDTAESASPSAKSEVSKSSGQNADVVDLSRHAQELQKFLKGSIARFATEHPNTEVSCVALYFTTYGRHVYVNYETRAHSDASVKKYQESKELSYGIGKDSGGLFNKLPNDFEFAQHQEYWSAPANLIHVV